MVKIWAKLISENNKIIRDCIYKTNANFSIDDFETYIRDICYKLDIPTPMVLATTIRNFIMFNSATFFSDDFIEKIYFEKLQITNVTDN